jgi:tetratricopeptide (TPR) repeat protein
MTFAFGDYGSNPAIEDSEATAEYLFSTALKYHPDSRAYLGLGMLLQKKRAFADSVKVLEEGAGHFPDDVQIHTCLGISLMNMQNLQRALDTFMRFPQDRQCLSHAVACCQAMGKHDLYAELAKRLGQTG